MRARLNSVEMKPQFTITAMLLAAGSAAHAQEDAPPKVQLVLSPYAWVPTVTGNTALGSLSVPVRVTPRDFAQGIKIGGMGNIRIERPRDFIFAEAIIADYDNKNFRPFFGQALTSKVRYYEFGAGLHRTVQVGSNTRIRFSPYVGIQRVHLTNFVTGNVLTTTANGSWTNPVAGVVVEVPVSAKFSLTGKLDGAGFGITDTDYRSLALLANIRISKRVSLNAGYRWAKGRFDSDTGLALDLTAAGPQIGLRYVVPLGK
ncbi:MAG: hypothetical protein RIS52_2048 [Pseudomonadota bacterium]